MSENTKNAVKVVDAFGSKIGTRSHAINAALSAKKPKSVKEITEETKANAVYNHLRTLVSKGFAVKTEEGLYMLKPKNAAKGKKFASKDEANAARNERRRKARAAAKNSGEVVVSNEMPAEYATA